MSRRSRTGLIVSIVVVAVVLVGGGTAALMLRGHPAPQAHDAPAVTSAPAANGRYQMLIKCAKLTSPPFTFDPEDEPATSNHRTAKVCMGTFGAQRVDVAMTLYSGPNAEASAVQGSLPWSTDNGFQRLDGTGFENAPFTGYNGDYGPLCTAIYRRSNIDVRIDFPTLSNVSDRASCTSAIMPYVKQLYALIG